jgi:hypothetical protein
MSWFLSHKPQADNEAAETIDAASEAIENQE